MSNMLSKVENGGIMVDTYVHTEIHVLFEPLFLSSAQNGIHRGIGELEWHISKFSFCNGISPSGENWSGIDPINPRFYGYNINTGGVSSVTLPIQYLYMHAPRFANIHLFAILCDILWCLNWSYDQFCAAFNFLR
jgi:hypothetical protein